MSPTPKVLLTNDDGIEATGLDVLREALAPVADVTVVAPAENRSGVSRANSRRFDVVSHPMGHAVEGTPVDCVHFGLDGLETAFDLVVSGCNDEPNIGAHKLERSGTVAAAMEAGYLGRPGLAVSLYAHPDGARDFDRSDFGNAADVATDLVRVVADEGLPPDCDYLNVNVPADPDRPERRLTEPTEDFAVSIEATDDGGYRAWDHFYDPLAADDESVTDPVGSERRAVADREVSVSPLSVRHRRPDVDDCGWLLDGANEP